MSETKLKPCPFCGGGAELESKDVSWDHQHVGGTFTVFWVSCYKCFSRTGEFDRHVAIRRWNRRVKDE